MAISGGDGSIILTTKVDEAGLKKGFASMRSFVAKAGKSFAVIGAAATAATVAITKMAVSAYADYEQLVGGVETLFKGSAQKVIDYANNAFATAGMSANQYMEQVIGISAMLIKSTGDAEKAADVANMAITDMADNVNKMGTDMTRVQMAYQGFARQQYVLLDNLAIGYGGTKQEMERLLRDAQAITGVKYDINNLADVYSAIHAIQTELGITGTTAKEAEQTITGSANMMKAAWQNVLSAIAGGGDLDRAINNLVYSISIYFANIVPVVERSLVGIGKLIEQVAPMLVQNVASALIQAIPSLINAVYQMIIGLAKGIWAGIKALFTGGKAQIQKQVSTIGGGGGFSGGGISSGGTPSGTGGGGSGGSGAKGKSAEEKQIDAEIKAIQDKIKALQKENKQIQKNAKANQKANEKQLASFDDITTLGSNQMSEADAMIDKNNEEIDQLQEQLDLLREKKQAIQDAASASGGAGGIGEIGGIGGIGGVGGIGDIGGGTTFEETGGFEKEKEFSFLQQRLDELQKAFNDIKDIDLTNLTNSLALLKEPLQGLAEIGWDALLWGIENVIVPLSKFTIEEILPRFFETLAIKLSLFKTILDEGFTLFKQFYDEFLKPIASYAADGFLQLWDTWNANMEEFVSIFESSTAWQDLSTILGSIYDALEPVVKWMIDFVVWEQKFKINKAWTDLKWNLLDIEDRLGLVAAIIRGDFGDAWEHLKDLMWDNKIDKAKENLDNLKSAFDEVKTKVEEFVEDWKLKIDDMVESWKTKISAWWTDNVEPWFTKEKWEELFFKIGESLANAIVGANGFVEKWKTNITNWWNDDVSPWFTTAKWKEVFDNIVTSISNFFTAEDGFVQTWKTKISEWWTDEVTPWFTVEKWKELGGHIKNGLVDGFNGAINGIRKIINKILDGFQGLVNGAIDMLNSLISGYNKVADVTPGLPSINRISRVNLSKYKLPMLAQGAVIPPNRQFLAVLGDQKHGTNIEAPLDTIVEAMNIALQNNGTGQTTKEEHYYLNETELMSIVYRLFKGGERLQGSSLISGGAY